MFGKDGIGEVKFDDILGQIRKVYGNPMYADFDLYICGHRYVVIRIAKLVVARKNAQTLSFCFTIVWALL